MNSMHFVHASTTKIRANHRCLRRSCTAATVALLVVLVTGNVAAQPQRPGPHIGYVYPAGGRQGTTFTVSVGGQNLESTMAAYFSGPGISAKITGFDRPLTQKEINDLRDKLQQLQEKRTAARAPAVAGTTAETRPLFTDDEEKTLVDIRTKLANRPNRQANPALAETVTLEVSLAADAPPGDRELRLRANGGLSNPFLFVVGQLAEF